MKVLQRVFLLFGMFSAFFLGACATMPPNDQQLQSYAYTNTEDTLLGRTVPEKLQGREGASGFFFLSNGLDAFTARVAIAAIAEKSIDAQYYMIHKDLTGILFGQQLVEAANRGVRIRVLIDDMDLEGRDPILATLDFHPNISIRVFNPFSRNSHRAGQFLTGFGSVTRRMHNKSFTVDNQLTIVGGRNIGNEYFDADPALDFADLDLLAIGPVVQEVSASFDEYWNSSLAYSTGVLRPDLVGDDVYSTAMTLLNNATDRDAVQAYKKRITESHIFKQFQENKIPFFFGTARVLADHPDKLISYNTDYNLTLASQFSPHFERITNELIVFSPYFVPGREGTEYLSNLSKQGVRVRIFTNSLASTDVAIVHAGYAKYRTRLLRAGVELYEMNMALSAKERDTKKGDLGGSKASLHAKSFILDRKKVFIGSLNLDPRSIIENTEIGILLTSPEAARAFAGAFDRIVAKRAFRLELSTDDDGLEFITWYGVENGEERSWTSDPYTSIWKRLWVDIMSLFPIESQL